jgi:hypothetical protein
VWAFWSRDEFLVTAGSQTPDGPVHSPVIVPTELTRLQKNSLVCENYLDECMNKFLAIQAQKNFGSGTMVLWKIPNYCLHGKG